jgi:hypothetical protein
VPPAAYTVPAKATAAAETIATARRGLLEIMAIRAT